MENRIKEQQLGLFADRTSTATMRAVGSTRVDPYSAVAAASAALFGPLHGGANEAVLRMLNG